LNDALARFLALLPTLKEAELRVLGHLLRISDAGNRAEASSRAIAEAAGLARSNVQASVDSLTRRGLVTCDQGGSRRPSSFRLLFLETAAFASGPIAGPPLASQQGHLALQQGHLLASEQGHGGPTVGPPPDEESAVYGDRSKERARAFRSIDSDSSFATVIDRVCKASPKDFDAELLTKARGWFLGYMQRFGPLKDPHAPDDSIVAQFLSIAPWPRLEQMLNDLMRERCECGRTYAWFIAVAWQRVLGMGPPRQREAWALLKAKRSRPAPAEQRTFGGVAGVDVAELAKLKTMGRKRKT
jgi:hypothetical protein